MNLNDLLMWLLGDDYRKKVMEMRMRKAGISPGYKGGDIPLPLMEDFNLNMPQLGEALRAQPKTGGADSQQWYRKKMMDSPQDFML